MSMIIDGTNGLTFNNATTQASAGSVIQVVNATYATQSTTTGTSAVDTGLTATITPKFSTSKILVLMMNNGRTQNTAGTYSSSYFDMVRGSTLLQEIRFQNTTSYSGEITLVSNINMQYLDSPATTSATTYKMQMYSNAVGITTYSCINGNVASITLLEIAQ
jgi:hypothetical protein